MYLTLSCCHLACPASLWHSGEACLTLGQWGTPLCAPRLLARVSMTGLTALYFIYLSSHLSSKMDCQLLEGTDQILFVFIFLVYSLVQSLALVKYLLNDYPHEGNGRCRK